MLAQIHFLCYYVVMNSKTKSLVDRKTTKVVQALGFFLNLDDNHKMGRVKLIKLLWAADRRHLRTYGRTVSGTDYVAMVHGPVSSLALDVAQINEDFALSQPAIEYIKTYFTADSKETGMTLSPGDDHLSDTDKEALSWAWSEFGASKTFDLADDVSHRYPEWAQYATYFDQGMSGARPIDIKTFFENPETPDEYFSNSKEELSAATQIYNDSKKARSELDTIFGA